MTSEMSSSSDDESRSTGLPKRLLSISSRHWDRLFTVSLLVFFGGILLLTFQYNPTTQLFPLVIGVPTFLLSVVLFLTQSSSRAAALTSSFAASDVFDFEAKVSDQADASLEDGSDSTGRSYAQRKRLIIISLWMLSLLVLVILIGLLPASIAFLLGFYVLYTDCGWARSVAYTIVFTAFIIIVFGLVMDLRFYQGIAGVRLPI